MPDPNEKTASGQTTIQPTPSGDGKPTPPEVSQASQTTDPNAKLRDDLLEQLRKENAEVFEKDRREMQARIEKQSQAQVDGHLKRAQAESEAQRKAMLDALKEVVSDDDVLKQVQAKEPLYRRAALQELNEQDAKENQARQIAEQQAYSKLNQINLTYGVNLTRDDFPGDEWGGGRTVDQWYSDIAVPKAVQKKLALEKEALAKQVETERKKVVDEIATGASVTDLGGNGLPARKPKNTLNDAYDLEDAIRRNIFNKK